MTNPTNRLTKRRTALIVIGLVAITGALSGQPTFTPPVSGQAATLSLPDAYSRQATQQLLATEAAYQQAQSAAAAQAAAAQAQAQAAALAQQATLTAFDQQQSMVRMQATIEAVVARATASQQETRTAFDTQATVEAGRVQATATQQALRADVTRNALAAQASQVALEQTRTVNDAQRRDAQAIATSVAINLEATRQTLQVQAAADARTAETTAQLNAAFALIAIGLAGSLALVIAVVAVQRGRRALGALTDQPTVRSTADRSSEAAHAVYDAATGAITRLPVIEPGATDDLAGLLRALYGD